MNKQNKNKFTDIENKFLVARWELGKVKKVKGITKGLPVRKIFMVYLVPGSVGYIVGDLNQTRMRRLL